MMSDSRKSKSYKQFIQQVQIAGQGKTFPAWVKKKLISAYRVPLSASNSGTDFPIDDEKTQRWLTENLGLSTEFTDNVHSREGIDVVYDWRMQRWCIHNY